MGLLILDIASDQLSYGVGSAMASAQLLASNHIWLQNTYGFGSAMTSAQLWLPILFGFSSALALAQL